MPRYVDVDNIGSFMVCAFPDDEYAIGWNEAIAKIETSAPTADVAPVVHAHWIHTGEYLTNSDGKRLKKLSDLYVCHRCHRVEAVPELYCNCGAKMDENMKEEAEQ